MKDRQPKPQTNGRNPKRETEQVPKTKLQIVWTLDGVSAESLLIYKNKPVRNSLSKTRFFPSENVQSKRASTPKARHHAQVRLAVQDMVQHKSQHEKAIATQQYQKDRSASKEREVREVNPKKERVHERK